MTVIARRDVRKYMVFPAGLLILNAFEEVLVYKTQLVRDDNLRVAILLGLFAFGIGLVSFVLTPLVEGALTRIHRNTRRGWGFVGELVLFALALVGLFQLYFMVYVDGPQTILPLTLRN